MSSFKESYKLSIALDVVKAGPTDTTLYKRCSDIVSEGLDNLEAEIQAELKSQMEAKSGKE